MGRNKQRRKKKRSLEEELAKHLRKIAEELEKPAPNYGRIDKWRKDVTSFEREIAKVERRLPGKRQKR